MFVSAEEMLKKAVAGHYAVGQFNINNLEWTKEILLAAEEAKSPVILGVSEGAGKYMTGFKTTEPMKAASNVSKPDFPQLCSTVPNTQSKKMSKRQKSL